MRDKPQEALHFGFWRAKQQPPPQTTTPGEGFEEDIDGFLCPRAEDKQISRRTRWTVLRLGSEGPTEGVYDALWQALANRASAGSAWPSTQGCCAPCFTRAMTARLSSLPSQRAQRLTMYAA